MTRRASIAALLIAATSFAGSADAGSQPTVRVAALKPLVVRGAGFRAEERIAVTAAVAARARATRRATADARGSFTVRFALSVARCERFTLQAFGSRGSRARLVRAIQPDCEPGDE